MLTDITTLGVADRLFLREFLPDEGGAPWMPVTDWHLLALIAALLPLRWYAERAHPEWTVGSELAVWFPVDGGRNYVVPDLFVAHVAPRRRRSFDSAREGGFPVFVLEIVSEESRERDTSEKARLYGLLGVREYVVFDPEGVVQPPLQGHHRDGRGEWAPWLPDAAGELQSRVLGLSLAADGSLLRLVEASGMRLLTPDEERQRAEQERLQAQQERARADQEQARADAAEAELARLRALLGDVQPPA